MLEKKQLFEFLLQRVEEIAKHDGLKSPQAFGKWFVNLYFENPRELFISDGSRDGKVDLFLNVNDSGTIQYHVLNTKFTEKYDERAPVSFYDEITRFWQAFKNKSARGKYLDLVRPELKLRYRKLFDRYEHGKALLMFVTNHRRNEKQSQSVQHSEVRILHFEDICQFMADYIEGAMPRTRPMLLTGINTVLTANESDSEVPTSIVFARLIDFIKYMEEDPYDLLFARNIRLSLGPTPVNKEIARTFKEAPREFAFSNNGITLLCERHTHDPGSHEVTLENPRIVNGSQTLHSIRDCDNPSTSARIMVRIIEVSPSNIDELPTQAARRKQVISKIAIRSNLQNPIKKWNLVANDDFQQELARHFRKKGLFYERRKSEWKFRRTELKSVGINKGPEIRSLTQLIACYYWDKTYLGPANAKKSVGELFEDKPYELMKSTRPELIYQLYLIEDLMQSSFKCWFDLKYIQKLARHIDLSLFALIIKALQSANADFGSTKFSEQLENGGSDSSRSWKVLVKKAVDDIRSSYKKQNSKYRRAEGKELSFNNFFKTQGYVAPIFSNSVPRLLKKAARATLS